MQQSCKFFPVFIQLYLIESKKASKFSEKSFMHQQLWEGKTKLRLWKDSDLHYYLNFLNWSLIQVYLWIFVRMYHASHLMISLLSVNILFRLINSINRHLFISSTFFDSTNSLFHRLFLLYKNRLVKNIFLYLMSEIFLFLIVFMFIHEILSLFSLT